MARSAWRDGPRVDSRTRGNRPTRVTRRLRSLKAVWKSKSFTRSILQNHTGGREMAIRRADCAILFYSSLSAASFQQLSALVECFRERKHVSSGLCDLVQPEMRAASLNSRIILVTTAFFYGRRPPAETELMQTECATHDHVCHLRDPCDCRAGLELRHSSTHDPVSRLLSGEPDCWPEASLLYENADSDIAVSEETRHLKELLETPSPRQKGLLAFSFSSFAVEAIPQCQKTRHGIMNKNIHSSGTSSSRLCPFEKMSAYNETSKTHKFSKGRAVAFLGDCVKDSARI